MAQDGDNETSRGRDGDRRRDDHGRRDHGSGHRDRDRDRGRDRGGDRGRDGGRDRGRDRARDDTIVATVRQAKNYVALLPGSTMQRKLAAAVNNGDKAVSDYFGWLNEMSTHASTLIDYVNEHGTGAFKEEDDGYGNTIYRINPPSGGATAVVRANVFSDQRSDPQSGVVYQGVHEIQIDVGGDVTHLALGLVGAGTVLAEVTLAIFGKQILTAVRNGFPALVQRLKQFMASDGAENVDAAGAGAVEEATPLFNAPATEAETGVEIAVEGTATAVSAIGYVVAVIGVVALVLDLLIKDFTHRLEVHNLTELKLELNQGAYSAHGELTMTPWGGDTGAAVLWPIVEPSQPGNPYFATSATFVAKNSSPYAGLGYVVSFKPNDAFPTGIAAMIDVPYGDPNSIWVSFDTQGGDWKRVWDSNHGQHQVRRFEARQGDYAAIITIDALTGNDDGYNSTLTIINTARYPDLLDPTSA